MKNNYRQSEPLESGLQKVKLKIIKKYLIVIAELIFQPAEIQRFEVFLKWLTGLVFEQVEKKKALTLLWNIYV